MHAYAEPRLELHHQRRWAAAALALSHDLPKGRSLFVRRPGWKESPDGPDALVAEATIPRRLFQPEVRLHLEISFVPGTAIPIRLSCQDEAGNEVGRSPHLSGGDFVFRHPGAPTRISWADALTRLYAHVQHQVQPKDEIGYASLLILHELMDYTEAMERELPGLPFSLGTADAMLHDGPDTPIGRALFNCIKRMGNDDLWYCQAVASMWIAHGRTIEENCILVASEAPGLSA